MVHTYTQAPDPGWNLAWGMVPCIQILVCSLPSNNEVGKDDSQGGEHFNAIVENIHQCTIRNEK